MSAVEARELFRVHRTSEGDAAALQGLTLRVAEGETVVVLGPSGAGKSTLLRVLAGLEAPSAGTALVLGEDVGHMPARRRAAFRAAHVGLVDQHYDRALPAALSCRDIVALPLALRGEERAPREARALELLDRVGLADRAGDRPAELSGGEQQRLAVCAAVAHRPGLLLADEPGGELDAAAARAVYELIAELAREEGTTVVLVSHDPAATSVADRVVRLRDGRISGEAHAGTRGEEAIVVGRGGWLRLPEELLREAGLGDRLRARPVEGGVVLEPASGPVAAPVDPAPRTQALGRVAGAGAELRGVDKAYGAGRTHRQVLDGFSARFEPGRLTALSGRSGSGKSTILRLLAGLELPDSGEVRVDGESPAAGSRADRARLRRRALALVTQEPSLVDFLSAAENVALGLALRGAETEDAEARAESWLAELGLGERARQRVHRLSAGERQRVALARALASAPPLLLVDEPTARLDEANAAAIGELLASAAREHGTTIVCATHEPLLIAAADEEVAL